MEKKKKKKKEREKKRPMERSPWAFKKSSKPTHCAGWDS
jgi:hypothetical protein